VIGTRGSQLCPTSVKKLENASVKLASVLNYIFGASEHDILGAVIGDETDPDQLPA
jgi:hypothetical protein